MLKPIKLTAIGIALLASLTACKRDYTSEQGGPKEEVGSLAPSAVATAMLRPTEGNEARGTVNFASTSDGVRVTVDMTGLDPGEHEIFVQENGDCTSIGSGTAPARTENGASTVEADASGRAHSEFVDNRLALEGQTSIVGRAVVIEQADDNDADANAEPGEDTDTDVACGVIVATRP